MPQEQVNEHPATYRSERDFGEDVLEEARRRGWQPFHLRDRDSMSIVRGRGFPDLVMYRKDPRTGRAELVAAELKRDSTSELRDDQEDWIDALDQHFPAFRWRPKDWDEIERVLRDGPIGVRPASIRSSSTISGILRRSQIPSNFSMVIKGIAETIESKEFETGDRAHLRRMDPNRPDTAAFWRLMAAEGIPRNPDIGKWGLILHGIAIMAHGADRAHAPNRSVGQVLYEGGSNRAQGFYSEHRLATLLSAEGHTLTRLLARLFRMLASDGCSFDWCEMAWFILNEGRDEEQANESRYKIASKYYQAERRAKRAESQQ